MKKRLRPLGDITDDMELLLFEMTEGHKLQKQEILAIINSWIDAHAPHAIPIYEEDGTQPVVFIGHISNLRRDIL